jgi:hypothetical protein
MVLIEKQEGCHCERPSIFRDNGLRKNVSQKETCGDEEFVLIRTKDGIDIFKFDHCIN